MITYTVFTDRGGREVNEDSARVFEKDGKKCLVLCDGLGGHGKGEVASALVVCPKEQWIPIRNQHFIILAAVCCLKIGVDYE